MHAFRKWLIVAAALLPQMYAWGISVSAQTLWGVPWMKTYAASHTQLTATSMCMLLGIGCFSPIGGYIAEKTSVRNLLALGLVVMSLTYFLISRASSIGQITLLHALPLAAGLVLTSAMMGQILAVRLFHPKPGMAIGIVSMGSALGGIVAPLVISTLLSSYSWQTAIVILAVGGAVLLPIVLSIIPGATGAQEADQNHQAVVASVHLPLTGILVDRVFVGLVMIVIFLNLLFNAVFYNLGPYLHEMGGDTAGTARILSVTSVTAALGTVSFAALADRVDYRLILLLAMFLVGSGVAVAAGGANVGSMQLVLPAMGAAIGGLYSLAPAILVQRFGRANFARANGLILPFAFLGSLGPFIAGIGRDRLGSYPQTFIMLLGLMVIPVIGMVLLTLKRRGAVATVVAQS
jgi:MFS family permease